MPRDGSGIYSRPPGTDGVSDTSIESTKYNSNVADVETDLNTPRPIVAGGTGSNTTAGARDNLDAEVAGVQVTNYDSHVFESGSFWSAIGATGAPNGTDSFTGNAVLVNNSQANITIQARSRQTNVLYVRQKSTTWSAWTSFDEDRYVNVAGDTMTGALTVPALTCNTQVTCSSFVSSTANVLLSQTGAGTVLLRPNGGGSATGQVQLDSAGLLTVATSIQAVSGYLGVGGAPILPTARLNVRFTSGNYGLVSDDSSSTVGNNLAVFTRASGAVVLGTIVNSANTGVTYGTTSDERLKEDLKSFDAGNIVDDTNVYDFAWKTTGERAYGIIAQQAKDVYPQATVYTESLDQWFIDYSKYVPVIMQELKALRARVAELEGKLAGGAQPA